MRKPKTALDYKERLKALMDAGLDKSPKINSSISGLDRLSSLEERIVALFNIMETKHKIGNMLFFVMYDIESNKVRTNVAKYLLRQGCTRIQKSIFLGNLERSKVKEIRDDLTEIQSLYDNYDSIIICPVSTEQIGAMKVIGQHIAIDVITRSKSTLFF